MTRLGMVFSHPIQHYAPMCREIARRPGLDVRVFYGCDWGVTPYRDAGFGRELAWDVPLLEGYAHEFLPIARRPRRLTFHEVDNPAVGERLEAFGAQAVWIHGYGHRTQWRAWRWCRGRARRLFFGDSELLHHRPLASRMVKRLLLPWFYRPIDAFMTIGDNNEAYYAHYGVPRAKMFRGACPVDVQRFVDAVAGVTDEERLRRRATFGLRPEAVVALFSGKLIGAKRPGDLLEAVARLRGTSPVVQVLFVGSGELEPALRSRARALGAEDAIKFAGFVNQKDIPATLHLGDLVVMPSEMDPHPLAVTEAMAVGNAVVASDRVGCVGPTDAARPGDNALVYPCGDTAALSAALHTLATDAGRRERMRTRSREVAWSQSTRVAADAVVRAVASFGLG